MYFLSLIDYKTIDCSCLVPIRRFPSPSRSIHFGEVSGIRGERAGSGLTASLGPGDPKRVGRTE